VLRSRKGLALKLLIRLDTHRRIQFEGHKVILSLTTVAMGYTAVSMLQRGDEDDDVNDSN
jgi:hypothetical protein